jgi:hypothetical protein
VAHPGRRASGEPDQRPASNARRAAAISPTIATVANSVFNMGLCQRRARAGDGWHKQPGPVTGDTARAASRARTRDKIVRRDGWGFQHRREDWRDGGPKAYSQLSIAISTPWRGRGMLAAASESTLLRLRNDWRSAGVGASWLRACKVGCLVQCGLPFWFGCRSLRWRRRRSLRTRSRSLAILGLRSRCRLNPRASTSIRSRATTDDAPGGTSRSLARRSISGCLFQTTAAAESNVRVSRPRD